MEDMKWYRVTDALNPLYGCDVRVMKGIVTYHPEDFETTRYGRIYAMRRMDLLVGDRPFQLVAPDGEDLGIMISEYCLDESPIQDDVVPTGTDRPHGLCIDESEMTRQDGVTLRIARYERATQIAVEDPEEGLLATTTTTDVEQVRDAWERTIINMFERGDDVEDIAYALEH